MLFGRQRSFVSSCAAVGLVLAGGAVAHAALAPYSDNFDADANGSQAGFTVSSGGVASSTAFVVSNPTGTSGTFNNDSPLNTATSAGMQFTNLGTGVGFVEKITVTPTAPGENLTNDFFGIAALGTSADFTNANAIASNNTLYLADLQGSKGIRILKIVNSTATTLVSGTYAGTVAIGTAETLTLTGTYVGGSLSLSLNVTDGTSSSTISTSTPDATPLTGQFFGPRNRDANTTAAQPDMNASEDNFSLVPEPASCALLLMPAVGMLLRRRRSMR